TGANGASGTGAAGGRAGAGKSAAAPPRIGPCTDRKLQVPNDPYSPPCVAFSGDNGGATSRGVSATEITISARLAGLPDFSAAPSSDNGPSATFTVKRADIKRTLEGLAYYFTSRFQFYGRTINLIFVLWKCNFQCGLQ